LFLGLLIMAVGLAAGEEAPAPSTVVPAGDPPAQTFVEGSWIELYEDYPAWFGEGTNVDVLEGDLGMVAGIDYGVNPTSELAGGFQADTGLVILATNSFGVPVTADNVNDPAAQAHLENFVQGGGVLVAHLGDNLASNGYDVPGLDPDLTNGPFPTAFTVDASATNPMVHGPDGRSGTADDLTKSDLDQHANAHGVLHDLPPAATVIISDAVTGKPVLAKYPRGSGTVIVTSMTLEYTPTPRQILINELAYAVSIAPERVLDPMILIAQLAMTVFDLNLHHGISNALDSKLDAALNALEDAVEYNDVAAVNALEAFINRVTAQSGNMISTTGDRRTLPLHRAGHRQGAARDPRGRRRAPQHRAQDREHRGGSSGPTRIHLERK